MIEYDAVIFDLDGTLVDSMWVWEEIDKEFLRNQGIEVPNDMDKELEGKSFTETAIYFKERFGLTMTVDEIKQSWNEMAWKFYTKKVTLKPGIREFLEYLKDNDIKMGIGSSNSIELINAVLRSLKIEEYFDQIRTSCEVGRGKPFPDIYLKVADDLQVEPSKCLVFEDIPNGIRAAKSAGMTAWGIKDRQTEAIIEEMKSLADHFVEDYNEVLDDVQQVANL